MKVNEHAVALGKKGAEVRLKKLGKKGVQAQMKELRAIQLRNKAKKLSTAN